jgi:hypothetical protein
MGYNFIDSDVIACRFGGDSLFKAEARFISSTQLECTTPPHSPAIVDVEVSFNGGVDWHAQAVGDSIEYRYSDIPVISNISPEFGPSNGGSSITITGSNFEFSNDLQCKFGSLYVFATFISSSEIICIAPASANASSIDITVSNNGHDISSERFTFTYEESPTITSISPREGPISGGNAVALTGIGFVPNMKCAFGDNNVLSTYVDQNKIVCTSPPASTSSSSSIVALEISSNGETYSAIGYTYRYIAPPVVLSLSPSAVFSSASENQHVTISGINFVDSDALKCKYADDESLVASARFIASSSIVCDVPPSLPSGQISVKVSVDAGLSFSSSSAMLSALAPFIVDSISPSLTTTSGRTVITVSGSGFSKFYSSYQCKFSEAAVTSATFVSDTTLTCPSPKGTFKSVPFAIIHNGQFTQLTDITFSTIDNLNVRDIYPMSAAVTGGSEVIITVDVTDELVSSYKCAFDKTSFVDAKVIDGLHVSCISPAQLEASTSTSIVTVHASEHIDFAANSGAKFTFYSAPEVDHIFPSSASTSSAVTISGKNFIPSSALSCKFGSSTVSARFVSNYRVECIVPKVAPLLVALEVSNNGVDYTSNGLKFKISYASTVTSI